MLTKSRSFNVTLSYEKIASIKMYSVKKAVFNPLSANPEKWSKTLKQIVRNLPMICLSVFDHFMNLALKGLKVVFCCSQQI